MMENVSFIATGEEWGLAIAEERGRGFVWPLVKMPVNYTATDSGKMIFALLYL